MAVVRLNPDNGARRLYGRGHAPAAIPAVSALKVVVPHVRFTYRQDVSNYHRTQPRTTKHIQEPVAYHITYVYTWPSLLSISRSYSSCLGSFSALDLSFKDADLGPKLEIPFRRLPF